MKTVTIAISQPELDTLNRLLADMDEAGGYDEEVFAHLSSIAHEAEEALKCTGWEAGG